MAPIGRDRRRPRWARRPHRHRRPRSGAGRARLRTGAGYANRPRPHPGNIRGHSVWRRRRGRTQQNDRISIEHRARWHTRSARRAAAQRASKITFREWEALASGPRQWSFARDRGENDAQDGPLSAAPTPREEPTARRGRRAPAGRLAPRSLPRHRLPGSTRRWPRRSGGPGSTSGVRGGGAGDGPSAAGPPARATTPAVAAGAASSAAAWRRRGYRPAMYW
jgi:hypothetical protein